MIRDLLEALGVAAAVVMILCLIALAAWPIWLSIAAIVFVLRSL